MAQSACSPSCDICNFIWFFAISLTLAFFFLRKKIDGRQIFVAVTLACLAGMVMVILISYFKLASLALLPPAVFLLVLWRFILIFDKEKKLSNKDALRAAGLIFCIGLTFYLILGKFVTSLLMKVLPFLVKPC